MNDERFNIFKRFSPEARKAVATAEWNRIEGNGENPNVTQRAATFKLKGSTGRGWARRDLCPIAYALAAEGKMGVRDVDHHGSFPGGSSISTLLGGLLDYGEASSDDYARYIEDQRVIAEEAQAFFQKWDSGHITADELFSALEALGFPSDEPPMSASEFVRDLVKEAKPVEVLT